MDDYVVNTTIIAVVLGFLLDAILGDPQNPYHPIRIIGFVITGFLRLYHRLKLKSNRLQFLYGGVMTMFIVLLFYFGTQILLDTVYGMNIIVGTVIESILCYFIIAAKALYSEGTAIYKLLLQNDLPGARKRLSLIVGRDTNKLNEEKIVKATVETVSENLSDGVIAPIIFMLLGGAPLGIAYKAINTLDSMVGYRNERYEYLGKFAARLDDLVNLVPARLSAFFMILTCMICGKDFRRAVKVYCCDRYKHLSPNSAHTEAVCAGALGIQLGGASSYSGKIVEKPTIGENSRPAIINDINDANILMYGSAILALLSGLFMSILINHNLL